MLIFSTFNYSWCGDYFLLFFRNFEGDVQESATPITSRKDNSNVAINIGNCGPVENKENEYKCASANISNDTPNDTIEMFTTCGGY